VGRSEGSEQTLLCLAALADRSVCVDEEGFVVFLAFEQSRLNEQGEEGQAVGNPLWFENFN